MRIKVTKTNQELAKGQLTLDGKIDHIYPDGDVRINMGLYKTSKLQPIEISLVDEDGKEYKCSDTLQDKLLELYNQGIVDVKDARYFKILYNEKTKFATLPEVKQESEEDLWKEFEKVMYDDTRSLGTKIAYLKSKIILTKK